MLPTARPRRLFFFKKGTFTWLPSLHFLARFTRVRSASSVAPPATSRASWYRMPGSTWYRPGFCTAPLM